MKTCTKCKVSEAHGQFARHKCPLCLVCHQEYLTALGTISDSEISKCFGKHQEIVRKDRVARGIPSALMQRVARQVVNGHVMKTCSKCLGSKVLEEFCLDKRSVDARAAECRVCHRERLNAYNPGYYARNVEFFAQRYKNDIVFNRQRNALMSARRRLKRYAETEQLKKVPCADCGLTFAPCVMDFDHRNRDQKVNNINRLSGMAPWVVVLEEIAKCEIRCARCHRLKSWRERITRTHQSVSKKRQMLRAIKAQPCVDCGGTFHYSQMDFDHVRGKKLGEVSRLTGLSTQILVDEISKCEVTCANCHRVRTAERKHGNRRADPHQVNLAYERLLESRRAAVQS
jgi:hypothetical protein